jgi:hypothetical protein
MRPILVSTDVFSAVWSHRVAGEETEDEILRRLLVGGVSKTETQTDTGSRRERRKVLWRDDVRTALQQLGGSAPLESIYRQVKEIRLRAGRRIPISIDAIVRRELEYNSSDSESYTRRYDWFYSVNGIGAGVWGIRTQGDS